MLAIYDVVIVGAGPAGLAAACAAKEAGAHKVLVLERDKTPGGILNQCIHNGFGLHYFKEELTGPEYAFRFIKRADEVGVEIKLDTMVLSVEGKTVWAASAAEGVFEVRAKAVVLAMGCRERTRGAIAVPGDRPAGIYTAGTAQRYINIEGWMVGRRVVILGSGDIGLIMARRLTLEGAEVLACVELYPYSNGLHRNIAQCLNDYNIPLYLSHNITGIVGKHRVERVNISRVDENRRPIPGTEIALDCDTVLLSVGLIPENELTRCAGIAIDVCTGGAIVHENMETGEPGVFSCGNVTHIHDLVDYVTLESELAGRSAAQYAAGGGQESAVNSIALIGGERIAYTVPQRIRPGQLEKAVDIFFRVDGTYQSGAVQIYDNGKVLCRYPRENLSPGKMEKICVPTALLREADGETLTVELALKGEFV